MVYCPSCRADVGEGDRFCRACGHSLTPAPAPALFGRPAPTPGQAAQYWRVFFRPFFTFAIVFFALFFLLVVFAVAAWFFMFGRSHGENGQTVFGPGRPVCAIVEPASGDSLNAHER
ncbi:MAG: zinc-ribbon domain-containing protein [Acidobacteriota bacterium]